MRRPTTPAGAATLFFVLLACGTDADLGETEPDTQPALQNQIRDSAGIRIIENGRPAEGSRLGWEIGAEPAVSIGSVEANADFQLFQVDDALRLGDGRLVVANGGSHQLLVFDEAAG